MNTLKLIKISILLSVSLIICNCSPYSKGVKIVEENEKVAILILDFQNDFFGKDAPLPVDSAQGELAITSTNKLLATVDTSKVEVIYIGNEFAKNSYIANWFRNGAAIAGSKGAEIIPEIKRVSNRYFHKDQPDAFTNKEFDSYLRDKGVGKVIVTGVFADQCVLSTINGAINRGYAVEVYEDCVATVSEKRKMAAIEDYRSLGVRIVD